MRRKYYKRLYTLNKGIEEIEGKAKTNKDYDKWIDAKRQLCIKIKRVNTLRHGYYNRLYALNGNNQEPVTLELQRKIQDSQSWADKRRIADEALVPASD